MKATAKTAAALYRSMRYTFDNSKAKRRGEPPDAWKDRHLRHQKHLEEKCRRDGIPLPKTFA